MTSGPAPSSPLILFPIPQTATFIIHPEPLVINDLFDAINNFLMCISKPQRVLSYSDGEALVDFEGTERKVKSPTPLRPGEWVLCQAGFVAKRITEPEAREMLNEWRELNDF
jgi:hydrogenase assembly chaperone HypC/HupF